jgi:uncharacterized protein YukE
MATLGGELDQLLSLKDQFDRQSENLRDLIVTLRTQLDATWWQGPAADDFREAWRSEFEPTLRKLEGSLQEAGAEVARRRSALIEAGS